MKNTTLKILPNNSYKKYSIVGKVRIFLDEDFSKTLFFAQKAFYNQKVSYLRNLTFLFKKSCFLSKKHNIPKVS